MRSRGPIRMIPRACPSDFTPIWKEPPRGAPGDLAALIRMSGLEALQTFSTAAPGSARRSA